VESIKKEQERLEMKEWIFIIINLFVLLLYGLDKWKAIHRKWRIPERVLILAAVPGAPGALLGMLLFRHKIRKPKFYLGVPAILLLEIAGFLLLQS
jgi:uncharacterized membrane protein YsdA (DUF1294 family)